jgi:class 3 adenylate cyclase/predicted ATPase
MDVGGWLRGLGLGQYEEKFRDNKIDADLLPRLTVDDLKDIGVSVVGDRRRLLDAIATIAGAGPASPTKSTPFKGHQASAERRPITVMFCDLVGSTSLATKLDAEDWRTLVNTYLDEASAAVTGLGGHVLKKLGDGLMALFGYPHAQENDAERAVRAALAIQRALSDLNARHAANDAPELSARIGLESGQVVVDATGEVFGEAPNVAARVQAAAEPGSVLITGSVQRQVAGLFVVEEKGARELKGVAQPLSLYRVVRASGGGRKGGARALTSFVGREEDIRTLLRRWDRVRAGEGQFVQIVGEPGLGKSRLVEEFHARLGETPHTWVEWNSSQLLQNTPLHPIAEWGRARFGSQDVAAERRLADLETTLAQVKLDVQETATFLAPLLDIPLPAERAPKFGPEELRRRQLAAMVALLLAGARTQPVVLAFEDLHWADPTSLDLIQALAERGAQAPLLVITTTRPEFRAPWGMRSHHAVVALAPLDRIEVRRMVGEIAAQHVLPQEVVERVSKRTGGVPLFVEEVTRLLVERGEQGGVQAIPPTLQQSLAARLDRLGAAREVAQIGSVLGRDFVYALLRGVAEIDESALQASLDRLAEADLLFVEGALPEVKYRFKHALIQDAAYESLLKSRRHALHRSAAELLRNDAERAAAEPEAIAHHFTEARLDDLAIEWWGKAGDQALRRSAFQEAIAHLGKAIAMADKAGGVSGQGQKLHVAYGNALIAARGYGAPETTQAFARAGESAFGDKDAPGRLAADYGRWAGSYVRGELSAMRAHAETFLGDVQARPDQPEAGVARRVAGVTHWFAGEYVEARETLEHALALFQSGRDDDLAFRFGHDEGVAAMLYLALTLWPLGEVGRAVSLVGDAEARMAGLAHIGSHANHRALAVVFELIRHDTSRAAMNGVELAQLAREHDLPFWRAFDGFLEGLAVAQGSTASGGLEAMRRGIELLREQNILLFDGLVKIAFAEAEAQVGDPERAVAGLDEALATCERIGHRTFEAELHRVRGEMLLKRDPANAATAEEALHTAIAVAQRQGTRSFELRAALALAKLYQSTGRPADAHAVLAPALEGFSPTPEMPEIAEAQALLAALAEMDEVRQQAAQQQRLTQLRVAYGNALIATRGYGAAETTEAFARVRESAFGDKDAPERLAAHYGLWAGSLVCGELSAMREHSTAFLTDVAANPDSPEAGVAHRTVGITHWFAGEYAEAREHLERALALFEPGRDDDLAFRFGNDAGVAAMHYLALTLWPMGDVGRAVSLVGGAEARVADLAHIGTRAYGKSHTVRFELMRGDLSRAALEAVELARLTREHALPIWRAAYGIFFDGLASAQRGTAGGGLEEMRRGIELLREQNVMIFDGLLKIALADAEACAGDVDRALATLNEALETCDRTGHRSFEAELHRVRGKTLLKRDPHSLAPAAEAFQSAIATAGHQGARSFELRASLSMAKLYQSTSRPADAHAILAPALEGFSPRSGMAEIAEARALLVSLAESDEVRAAEAVRQRRLNLQMAYGQAMMWSKGFAAEETKTAFARAAEFAGPVEDASTRLVAYYAQCLRGMVRGEYGQARGTAETFLREAEAEGRATEAAAARRMLGLTLLNQGELKAARSVLERALDDAVSQRDGETQFLFDWDTDGEASAAAYLALTEWHLGEPQRARQLIQRAIRRAEKLGHVATVANVLFFRTLLESRREDALATQRATVDLLRLTETHGIRSFADMVQVYVNWTHGRLVDPEAGALAINRGLAAHVADGNKGAALTYHVLLAELEATSRDLDHALTLIGEGLAIAEEIGGHLFDPYLHRLRGNIRLRRDPTNLAPAEGAFQTAVAIAHQQGARSHGLRAALSLAKLYQSTNRHADAHAVLEPALEGFAPTVEMSEIAEAKALLVAIEAGAQVRHE